MSAKVLKIASGQSSPVRCKRSSVTRGRDSRAARCFPILAEGLSLAYRAWGLMEVLSQVDSG